MARTKDPQVEEARRRHVADAAVAALGEGSWRSVTLEEVARRAGVSKGAVTYWFPSKEALFLEALKRFHTHYQEQLTSVALEDRPVRERLVRLIELAFPSQAAVAAEVRFQVEVWSFAKEHPAVLQAVQDAYLQFRFACEALVQIGVQEGWVNAPDVRGLYRFIHALMDGMSLHIAFEPEVDLVEIREHLLVLLERWLRTPDDRPQGARAQA